MTPVVPIVMIPGTFPKVAARNHVPANGVQVVRLREDLGGLRGQARDERVPGRVVVPKVLEEDRNVHERLGDLGGRRWPTRPGSRPI